MEKVFARSRPMNSESRDLAAGEMMGIFVQLV